MHEFKTVLPRSKDGSLHITDDRISTITALSGGVLSTAGCAILLSMSLNKGFLSFFSIFIYSLTLVGMFAFSTLHHAINGSRKTNHVLKVLDYSSIYTLIVGTTTPIVFTLLKTYPPAWGLYIAMFIVMSLGISLTASIKNLPKHISNTLFIVLGWLPILITPKLIETLSAYQLILLILGGTIYSIGFLLYSAEKPNPFPGVFGFHELWHCVVLIASSIHFLLIYSVI